MTYVSLRWRRGECVPAPAGPGGGGTMEANAAFITGAVIAGAVAGAVCGTAPLRAALKRDRPLIGLGCLLVCLAAGLVGGLCLAVPATVLLTWLVSSSGPPRSADPEELLAGPWLDEPAAQPAREPNRPYTRIASTVVCRDCRTATPTDSDGGVPRECPACGLPFRRRGRTPVVRRATRDEVIDLVPAPPPVLARPVGRRGSPAHGLTSPAAAE